MVAPTTPATRSVPDRTGQSERDRAEQRPVQGQSKVHGRGPGKEQDGPGRCRISAEVRRRSGIDLELGHGMVSSVQVVGVLVSVEGVIVNRSRRCFAIDHPGPCR